MSMLRESRPGLRMEKQLLKVLHPVFALPFLFGDCLRVGVQSDTAGGTGQPLLDNFDIRSTRPRSSRAELIQACFVFLFPRLKRHLHVI
jgi:hypothetical protein